jgi:hypothetical protein
MYTCLSMTLDWNRASEVLSVNAHVRICSCVTGTMLSLRAHMCRQNFTRRTVGHSSLVREMRSQRDLTISLHLWPKLLLPKSSQEICYHPRITNSILTELFELSPYLYKLGWHSNVVGYRLNNRGSIPSGNRVSSRRYHVQTVPGALSTSYPLDTEGTFPVGKSVGVWS